MKERPKEIMTITLIGINILVFIVLTMIGRTEDGYFMLQHGAMYEPYIIENQEYYRLFTSLFLHFGISHLLNNMVLLWALGSIFEKEAGKIRFLLCYFISGIAVPAEVSHVRHLEADHILHPCLAGIVPGNGHGTGVDVAAPDVVVAVEFLVHGLVRRIHPHLGRKERP